MFYKINYLINIVRVNVAYFDIIASLPITYNALDTPHLL